MPMVVRKGLFYSPLLTNEHGVNKLEKLYQTGVYSLKQKLASFFLFMAK